jgi:hypothetical protein
MKTILLIGAVKPAKPHPLGFGPAMLAALLLAAAPAGNLSAEETNATPQATVEKKAEKGPPLPLHQIEGNGGIFSTLSAYIVNPPRNGEIVGRPAVGFSYVDIGQGRNLEAFTLTESPLSRVELGYAYDRLDIGDLPEAVSKATDGAANIRDNEVDLHNFNARVQVLKEGEFDQKWLPAVTAGAHYKYNDTINRINNDVGGLLRTQGIKDNQGVDFTLYASKMITFLPRPVLLELGGRATKASHIGLLGFTDDYNFVFEGNVVVFVTSSLALAAEYRQKPDDFHHVGELIKPEDDWWTIDAAYVVNNHLTLAVGYGHFGGVLNHEADGVWGVTTKWEF